MTTLYRLTSHHGTHAVLETGMHVVYGRLVIFGTTAGHRPEGTCWSGVGVDADRGVRQDGGGE